MIQFTQRQAAAAAALLDSVYGELRERRADLTYRRDAFKFLRDRPLRSYSEAQIEGVDQMLAGLDGLCHLLGLDRAEAALRRERREVAAPPARSLGSGWWT